MGLRLDLRAVNTGKSHKCGGVVRDDIGGFRAYMTQMAMRRLRAVALPSISSAILSVRATSGGYSVGGPTRLVCAPAYSSWPN